MRGSKTKTDNKPSVTKAKNSTIGEARARRDEENRLPEGLDRALPFDVADVPAMIHCLDRDGRILHVSRLWLAELGYDRNAVIGRPLWDLMPASSKEQLRCQLLAGPPNGRGDGALTTELIGANGEVIEFQMGVFVKHDDAGGIDHIIGVLSDMSAHPTTRSVLAHLASHDPLTGLPNRRLLTAELSRARARADRSGRRFALMLVDLDHFKAINDNYGHGGGDELLREVGRRLQSTIRRMDFVCRLGGDEFAILVGEQADALGFASLAERLLASLDEPFHLADLDVMTGACIGVSIYPEDGRTDDELLHHADVALYAAKKSGRRTWRVFSRMMHQAAQARSRLNADLKLALERDEFFLAYQPIVRVDSLEVEAVEVLLRWRHSTRGMFHANQFVRALERSGDIVRLTKWIVARAAAEYRRWLSVGCLIPKLSVNLPAQFVTGSKLCRHLRKQIDQSGIGPHQLILEISETTFGSVEALPHALLELREQGMRIAIDDFGGGGLALSQINKIPVDILKLDRAFVQSSLELASDRALLEGVVAMARGLGLQTIAKRVETRDQFDHLRSIGLSGAQGYVFARPLLCDAVPGWLTDWQASLYSAAERRISA